MLFFHVRTSNQLRITGVDFCHKKVGEPRLWLSRACSETSKPAWFARLVLEVQIVCWATCKAARLPRCELRCGTFPYLSELGRQLPELPVCLCCGIKTDPKQQCCPHNVWLTYKMEVEGSRTYPKPVQLILFFFSMFRQLVGIINLLAPEFYI